MQLFVQYAPYALKGGWNDKAKANFLKAIQEHKQTKKPKSKGKTLEETRQLIEKGLSIEEIAEARNLTLGSIYNHVIKLYEGGMEIDFDQFISQQENQL